MSCVILLICQHRSSTIGHGTRYVETLVGSSFAYDRFSNTPPLEFPSADHNYQDHSYLAFRSIFVFPGSMANALFMENEKEASSKTILDGVYFR